MSTHSCTPRRPQPSCSKRTCRGCYGEIAEIVAETDGLYSRQTNGDGSAHQLNVIWRLLGEQMEETLVRQRSVVILDFLQATVKLQKLSILHPSTEADLKLQLVLLPDFTSKFHITNVLVMRDAHYHAAVPHTVNFGAIAAKAGTNRFVVAAAIKDSVREIGKYLQRNRATTLTIDVGVGFLEFQGQSYRMKWSPPFVARLKAGLRPQGRTVAALYDPPSHTNGGPTAPCRFDNGCTSESLLQTQVQHTILAESRYTAAEMNDGFGGSSYQRTHW